MLCHLNWLASAVVFCLLLQKLSILPCKWDDWKEALVFLLLKETAADFTFKNIRPVSNLPFISKLTENAASNQTHCHMAVNTFFHLSI